MQEVAQLLLNEGSSKSLEKLKYQQELQLIKQMGTT
jgi:hypothetical protein